MCKFICSQKHFLRSCMIEITCGKLFNLINWPPKWLKNLSLKIPRSSLYSKNLQFFKVAIFIYHVFNTVVVYLFTCATFHLCWSHFSITFYHVRGWVDLFICNFLKWSYLTANNFFTLVEKWKLEIRVWLIGWPSYL